MNHDQNKKTLRQFQCRDYLWEIFEQMSGELECSVDYLINEAMRQYARSRNYGVRTPGPGTRPPQNAPAAGAPPAKPTIPSAPPPPPARSGGSYPGNYGAPPPSAGAYPPPPQPPRPAAPAPQYPAPGGGYPPPPRPPSSYPPPAQTQRPPAYPGAPQAAAIPAAPAPFAPPPQPPPYSAPAAPPPLPGGGAPGAQATTGTLYVIFNGQKFPVTKEEFIIGRGTKTADLPIKDGNISRRHAAVIWQNGGWYIKDLGSTNGVEFQGRKIDSKRVEEGDVYQLCDYEIRFTYR